jgi:hypothetical protein
MYAPKTSSALSPIEVTQTSFSGGQRDRDHPSLLKENEYARAINIAIREAGLAKTRDGKTKKTEDVGASFQGATWYQPPGGTARIVQANGGRFWEWQGSGTSWTRIGTVQLNNTTSRVGFAVLNGTLLAACGENDNCYTWDGSAVNFTQLGNSNTDAPRGDIVCVQSNRVCMAGVVSTATLTNARSHIFYSDLLSVTAWNRSTNNSRVPTNGDEPVTALSAYRGEQILAFTRNSTHVFSGINSSTPSSGVSRQTLDPNVGCVAPDSVVVIGEDAFFVSSDKQVRTIKRTINDIAFGVSVPITYENPNLFERIKSSAVSKCAAIFADNYYLLSAPLDTNTTNSSTVPFDTLHQKQSTAGIVPICLGEWTNIKGGAWIKTFFSNVSQTYFIDSSNGAANLMFNGLYADDGSEIPVTIDMRALDFGKPSNDKTMHSVEVQVLDTYGNFDLNYAQDGDASFTAFYTNKTISDPNSLNLPIPAFPFDLPDGGVLQRVTCGFYRKGRSRYWQLQIIHTDGPINLKYITARAFIEMMNTRLYA